MISRQRGTSCTYALAAALVAFGAGSARAQDARTAASGSASASTAPGDPSDRDLANKDQIVVVGVRASIQSAIDDKRNATEIKDSITAEDIGQLANDNVSEALQRISGVQVSRSNDGEGLNVQIRGLSENSVQLNGQIISGTAADRGVNFQDLPAELFSGVEILKALSADQIEGSLGGTINLETRAPLSGRKPLIVNLSATDKYSQVGQLWRQDANLFVQKQFRDTPIGEIGVIVNLAYKRIGSYAEVYGGGDFDTAPGIWLRKTGADVPQNNPSPSNANYNFFYQPTIPRAGGGSDPNPYLYDLNEDPNHDGVSNAKDVYYVPGQFGFSERIRDDTKKSLNGTLEWRPAHNLDVRFDTVLTDILETGSGSNYSVSANVPRAGVLLGGPGNIFSLLATTPTLGDVYVLQSGRLASFTNRVGAAPSANRVARNSRQFALQAKWDVTPRLTLSAQGSTSRGEARTLIQGQLNTGIEEQGGANTTFNGQDFYNFVDYSLGSNKIPDVKFYEDPFPSPVYGVNRVVSPSSLVLLNPGDLNNIRQRYFQYQRNANDTANIDKSARFDLTWKPDLGFFKAFRVGARWAERGFRNAAYQNSNQNVGVYTAWDGVRAPAQTVNIQRVPVNPASTTDAGAAATSAFLAKCLGSAGDPNALLQFGGNQTRTYGSTSSCDFGSIEKYFNLVDIRAIDPTTGAGYYELTASRYSVAEDTVAAYLRADFQSRLLGGNLFGNIGVRYIRTKTSSSGYIRNAANTGYDIVTLGGKYEDWLPSANINYAFTPDLILRLAYSRTLGRPGLSQISPSLNITRSTVDPNYAGFGTAGNPNLKAVHSDNLDASLEWYYAKGSDLSVGVFMKNIDSTIFLSSTPVAYAIGSEVFSIRTYGNFGGTKIKGLEVGGAHAFTYLPGVFSHLGVAGNFTIIDEASDLSDQEGDRIRRQGLSKYAYNLSGYYDDGRFSVRLAYNWRSAFTRRVDVQLGFARPETLPEIEAARGQLDLAARMTINKNMRLTFNAINLTDTGTVRYLKYPQLVNYLAFAGRKYNIGISVGF